MPQTRRLIVAITGASGSVFGVRLLQALQTMGDIETHLLITDAGVINLQQELNLSRQDVEKLATVVHDVSNIGASIASGSFRTEGMIVAPCSVKTLASIAHGFSDNLVSRAADVILKERRRLILMVRETPFNLIHLRNMVAVTEAGAIVFPPLPALYHRPQTIDEMVDHTIGHVLALCGLPNQRTPSWTGPSTKNDA